MNESMPLKSGGQILVDCLQVHGVEIAFCVPGESYLAVLDALYDVREQLRLIVCRQEGGAAFMDAGSCGIEPTTVIDLTGEEPELLRLGKGDPSLFGVAA